MKISTRGRYALRLMLDLALHDTGDYIPLKEVASRQQMSDKYLEQIITQLAKAGYVQSTRGANGGYRLSMPPEKYTAGMILRLMEGSLAPVDCVDNPQMCSRAADCVTIDIWREMKEALDRVADSYTLADLVKTYRERAAADYYI